MTPTIDYSKIYTDAPEQHPNLILGSLQLLFWLFFRPTAWLNHLKRIDPALYYDDSELAKPVEWASKPLWWLLIQGYVVLPLLANFTLALVLWVLGESAEKIVVRVAWGMVSGTVLGVVSGVGLGTRLGVGLGIRLGMAVSVVLGVASSLGWSVASGVVSSMLLGTALFGVFNWFGVLLGIFSVFWVVAGVAWGVPVIINLSLSVVLYPLLMVWNILLYRLDVERTDSKVSLLRWHSAFWWDKWQPIIPLSLYWLDKHLLLIIERYPNEGQTAIDYLSSSRQCWAVLAVKIEQDVLCLKHCANVEAIRNVHHSLKTTDVQAGPEDSLPSTPVLRIFSTISKNVDAALNQKSPYNQRLVLTNVTDRLDAELQNLTFSRTKYAVRLRPIAKSWRQIIGNYKEELAKATELRQEIDSPYIIGVPLTEEQKIFTGRDDIGTRIEQLLLDRRRPPLLLYGQRRMGKTSLLNNLGRLLPSTIIPMFVDLQGAPTSASDHAGFLYNIAKGMVNSAKRQSALTLPPLTREALATDPFTCFEEWLDNVEQALGQNTALLALDEFEVLDSAIAKGRFDEQDVLGMLRHLIQHRPRFKVLLAGSHTIEEYQRWASYLINVQVVHISYLKEDEARQLIERPIKDFTLRYEPNAVERVLQLTRCHPFLVQLLCGEIVVLKNQQDTSVRRLATLADVEAAVPEALSSGSLFFADIQNNQVDAAGLAILKYLAAQGEGIRNSRNTILKRLPDVSESAFQLLLQRELIEEVEDGFRFQVELIRRWFAQM